MASRPLKVLHVLGRMNRGGAEAWLMHALRSIDRQEVMFDFLVNSAEPGAFDGEIRDLGGRVIVCNGHQFVPGYASKFIRALGENGPYDVVHSHVHHFSAITLALSRVAGVPVRIAHSHNDTRLANSKRGLQRQSYLRATEMLIRRCMTNGIGVSALAAEDLFGKKWSEDRRVQILYCGIDLAPFAAPPDKSRVREELGLPPEARVIGHVANFSPAKNHSFLLQIAAAAMNKNESVWLVLIGEGPLRCEIERQARQLGIRSRTKFLGSRPDVPRLMAGAMDVFVLPSLWEGLPLVAVEAQAAGLPCVLSSRITPECQVDGATVLRCDPDDAAEVWADTALELANAGRHAVHGPRRSSTQRAPIEKFSIQNSIHALTKVYGVAC